MNTPSHTRRSRAVQTYPRSYESQKAHADIRLIRRVTDELTNRHGLRNDPLRNDLLRALNIAGSYIAATDLLFGQLPKRIQARLRRGAS